MIEETAEENVNPQPEAALPPLEAARVVCWEAYIVVGSLLEDVGRFDNEDAQSLLQNLEHMRPINDDVLPWARTKWGPKKTEWPRFMLGVAAGLMFSLGLAALMPYLPGATKAVKEVVKNDPVVVYQPMECHEGMYTYTKAIRLHFLSVGDAYALMDCQDAFRLYDVLRREADAKRARP